jgi:hypothetical protein
MLDDTTRDRSRVSYFRNLRRPVGVGVVVVIICGREERKRRGKGRSMVKGNRWLRAMVEST